MSTLVIEDAFLNFARIGLRQHNDFVRIRQYMDIEDFLTCTQFLDHAALYDVNKFELVFSLNEFVLGLNQNLCIINLINLALISKHSLREAA